MLKNNRIIYSIRFNNGIMIMFSKRSPCVSEMHTKISVEEIMSEAQLKLKRMQEQIKNNIGHTINY